MDLYIEFTCAFREKEIKFKLDSDLINIEFPFDINEDEQIGEFCNVYIKIIHNDEVIYDCCNTCDCFFDFTPTTNINEYVNTIKMDSEINIDAKFHIVLESLDIYFRKNNKDTGCVFKIKSNWNREKKRNDDFPDRERILDADELTSEQLDLLKTNDEIVTLYENKYVVSMERHKGAINKFIIRCYVANLVDHKDKSDKARKLIAEDYAVIKDLLHRMRSEDINETYGQAGDTICYFNDCAFMGTWYSNMVGWFDIDTARCFFGFKGT